MARILVVDDSRLSRAIVGNTLRDSGHEVVEAADGIQGLEVLKTQSFDLIISDILMPKMDGISMLRQIREGGNGTPTIVCSADIQESTRQACDAFGISAFMNKPIKADALLTQVNSTLVLSEVAQ